jgi:hypothetical protein
MRNIIYLFIVILLTSCSNKSESLEENYFVIDNGVLRLTADQMDEPNALNNAISVCARAKNCRVVFLPFGEFEIKENLVCKNYISLEAVRGTTVNLYPKDSLLAAVYYDREKRSYAEEVRIEGINFQLKSPAKSVIQTNSSIHARLIDCVIDANNNAPYALIIGGDDSPRAINTYVNQGDIREATDAGVYVYNTGSKHTLDRVHVRLNETGVKGYSNVFIIENCQIEANKKNIDIYDGTMLNINNTTFERGEILVSNIGTFLFDFCKISSNPIILQNVKAACLSYSRLNGVDIQTDNPISFIGNEWQKPNANEGLKELCDIGSFVFGNYNEREGFLEGCK